MRLRRGAGRLVAVSVATGLVLPAGLAGCQTRSGVAAFVGKDTISTSSLGGYTSRSVANLQKNGQSDAAPARIQPQLLDLLIYTKLVELTAADSGVTASDSEVQSAIDGDEARSGGPGQLSVALAQQGAPVSPKDLPLVYRALVLVTKLRDKLGSAAANSSALSDRLMQTARRVHVRVNPRFGTYDVAALQLKPPANDLSGPVSPPAAVTSGTGSATTP